MSLRVLSSAFVIPCGAKARYLELALTIFNISVAMVRSPSIEVFKAFDVTTSLGEVVMGALVDLIAFTISFLKAGVI